MKKRKKCRDKKGREREREREYKKTNWSVKSKMCGSSSKLK